jgi:hypothetical protein
MKEAMALWHYQQYVLVAEEKFKCLTATSTAMMGILIL